MSIEFIFLLLFLHCVQCCTLHTPALIQYGNWVNSLPAPAATTHPSIWSCRCVNLTRLKYERVLFDWDPRAMITYLHMIYFDKSSSFFGYACVGKQTISIIGYWHWFSEWFSAKHKLLCAVNKFHSPIRISNTHCRVHELLFSQFGRSEFMQVHHYFQDANNWLNYVICTW